VVFLLLSRIRLWPRKAAQQGTPAARSQGDLGSTTWGCVNDRCAERAACRCCERMRREPVKG
jgi:hypothetical protein